VKKEQIGFNNERKKDNIKEKKKKKKKVGKRKLTRNRKEQNDDLKAKTLVGRGSAKGNDTDTNHTEKVRQILQGKGPKLGGGR